MKDLAKTIGSRIRSYRTNLGLSQEKLAELSGCHPTYIGQIERGEKNATVESVAKIAVALNISLSTLFENLTNSETQKNDIPFKCYEFLLTKSEKEQQQLFKILLETDKYKSE